MAELTQNHKVQKNWIVVIAIILIASTLRAPLTSVGPVIHEIKEAMSINDSIAGFLTTIPLIIFAIVSPLVSKVTTRLTMSYTLLYSTLLLIVALILRIMGDFNVFIIGTILLGGCHCIWKCCPTELCKVVLPNADRTYDWHL